MLRRIHPKSIHAIFFNKISQPFHKYKNVVLWDGPFLWKNASNSVTSFSKRPSFFHFLHQCLWQTNGSVVLRQNVGEVLYQCTIYGRSIVLIFTILAQFESILLAKRGSSVCNRPSMVQNDIYQYPNAIGVGLFPPFPSGLLPFQN